MQDNSGRGARQWCKIWVQGLQEGVRMQDKGMGTWVQVVLVCKARYKT